LKPHVSIAMATHNGEAFIREQLNSLINQTECPDEIVIVDDASTDKTYKLLTNFKKTSPVTIQLHRNKTNKGVIKSFEIALKNCHGDIVFFSDQDDIWHEKKISCHLKKFESHPDSGFIFSNSRLISEDGKDMQLNLWTATSNDLEDWEIMTEIEQLLILIRQNVVYGHTLSIRSCYKNLLFPFSCNTFTHDIWISIFLTALGHNGLIEKTSLVDYRQHHNQVAGATVRGKQKNVNETNQYSAMHRRRLSFDYHAIARQVEDLGATDSNVQLLYDAANYNAERSKLYECGLLAGFQIIFILTFNGKYRLFGNSYLSALKDMTMLIFTK